MVDEWKDCLLGDVIELKRGYDLPRKKRLPGDVPLISSSGVTDSHALAMVKGPGVVTGRYGTLGQVFYVEQDFWPLNTTLYVRDFKGNDPRFISYFLRGVDFSAYSDKAAVPGLNRNHLHQAKVRLPTDLTEQRAIAHILGSLDDKIELNRRMNETLEAMASALFKSWFVDFDPVMDNALAAGNPIPEELLDRAALRESLGDARKPLPDNLRDLFPDDFALTEEMGWIPKGWEVDSLSNIATLNPESWTAKTAPAQIQYVDLANTKNGRINLIVPYQFVDAPSRARRVLRQDDTIIGTVRPGNRSFAYIHDDDLTGSTGFAVMRPTEECFRSFVYLCLTRDEVIDHFAHLADGGAYPAIRSEVVADFACAQPEKELFIHFDKLVSPWIYGIGEREAAIKSLSMLRDTLLPKLLSGEIRIPEAEKLVEAAG
ncbi:MAG: restriction endonuclease subunit S [Desulfobulbus sp.]|jgi:type I restriction enzyme S subunit